MWNQKDIDYLIKNYNNLTNIQLAEKLDRTKKAISHKLSSLGLKRRKDNRRKWTNEEIIYLNEVYSEVKNKEIAKHLNRSIDSILNKAIRLGLNKNMELIYKTEKINKLLKYKYVCNICNRFGTNTLKGLSSHLSLLHSEINQEKYYLNNIGEVVNCYYCNNSGKFINLTNGYRNLCDSEQCISKSRNTQEVSYLMKQGYSKLESTKMLNQLNNTRKETYRNTINNILELNKKYTREKSPNCFEFYLKRGYCKNVAKIMANRVVLNMQKTSHKNRKESPDDYLESYNTKIEYYINNGYSEEEAHVKLVKRQTTFSKKICIEKYGKEKGLKIWQERQDKWQSTLNNKSEQEKEEINRKKISSNSFFSKISQELFWKLYNNINNNYKIFFKELNKEYIFYDKISKKHFVYDYIDIDRKKCIEFNGYFWHCKPGMYNEKYYNKIKGQTAKEIWEYDKIKNNFIISEGYKLLIVWEDEYKKDKQAVVNKCIKFINN